MSIAGECTPRPPYLLMTFGMVTLDYDWDNVMADAPGDASAIQI